MKHAEARNPWSSQGLSVDGTLVREFLCANGLRVAGELNGAERVMSVFVYRPDAHVPD